MWTTENRARYDRSELRYPSDLTDAEWMVLAPLIPPAKRGGNKRRVDERALVDGLLYILSTGLPVASDPQGPAAAQYTAQAFLPLGVGRWE